MRYPDTDYKIKNSGFTLIELLVATVISVAMLTLVMASFWTLWQTYRTSELMRDMQHEATFALTRISDKVRNQGIDYSQYLNTGACVANINTNLCVKDNYFFTYKPTLAPPLNDGLFMGDYIAQDPLFSHDKFAITELRFSKFPGTEPTRTNVGNQFQPQVSVHFKMESRLDVWGRPVVAPEVPLSLEIQTTISSRDYNF